MDNEQALNSDAEVLRLVSHYLITDGLDSGELTAKQCEDISTILKGMPCVANGVVRISLERFSESDETWWIQATTHPDTNLGVRFSREDGLTGWLLRTKRRSLYLTDKSQIPEGVRSIAGYGNTSCAFLYAVRINGRMVGSICAVSDHPLGISRELAATFYRLGHLMDLMLSRVQALQLSSRPSIAEQDARTRNNVIDWLLGRVPSHLRWANLWIWNGKSDALSPLQATRELRERGDDWLHPLRLGEGFVGTCAKERTTIIEQRIDDSTGENTKITTPLPEIVPGIKFSSILTVPVQDQDKFYGVLAILGETYDFFHPDDIGEIEGLSRDLSHLLRERDTIRLANIQRDVRNKLDGTLYEQTSPTEYWSLLNGVFAYLSKEMSNTFASLWVRKRTDPSRYSCKSFSWNNSDPPYSSEVRVTEDKLFRAIITSEGALKPIGKLPAFSPALLPLSSDVDSLWYDKYMFDKSSKDPPNLVGIVGIPKRDLYSDPLGMRRIDDLYSQLYYSIFATTRAVLTFKDVEYMTRHQAWLIASETHELRQPLTTIKHSAERIVEYIEQGEAPKGVRESKTVIEKAEDIYFKLENILYKEWTLKARDNHKAISERDEAYSEIDVIALLEGALSKARQRYPDTLFLLRPEIRDDDLKSGEWQLILHGRRRWLELAIRNVLDNAVKYGMSKPVEVSFSVEKSISKKNSTSVIITIRDRGCGIALSEQNAIFRPGHRSDQARKTDVTGSQVALSITQDIMFEHKGTIWVQSEINKGATFFLKLPAVLRRIP